MPGVLIPRWSPTIVGGYQYQVDFSHPLAYGLTYVNVLTDLSGTAILTNRANVTPANTGCSMGQSPAGVGIRGSANTSRLNLVGSGPKLSTTIGTCMVYTTLGMSINSGTFFLVRLDDGTETNSFLIFVTGNALEIGWYGPGGLYGSCALPAGTASGQAMVIGCAYDTSLGTTNGRWGFVNGKRIANTNTNAVITSDTSNYNLCIGNSPVSNTLSWIPNSIGHIHWVAFWNRALSDSEAAYLNANPMCFLIPKEDEMSVLPQTYVYQRPDADITDGGWLNESGGSELYSHIDDVGP